MRGEGGNGGGGGWGGGGVPEALRGVNVRGGLTLWAVQVWSPAVTLIIV